MTPDPQVQASMDALRSLLREASVIQARQYFSDDSVQLAADVEHYQLGQVLRRHMVIVILNGAELRVVHKVHFNLEQVRAYREAKGCAGDDLAERRLIDFMKELSNQMGGRVCRLLETYNISMGMSVPLCTRGIHEIYADYGTKLGAVVKFGDFWRLAGAFGPLYCSAYVELVSKGDYSHIRCVDEQADEGELDFL